jgi:outer membrane protein assembly factor BamA
MIGLLLSAFMVTQAPVEKIAEIRVHGNVTLDDAAVIALAGITLGSPLEANGLDAIKKRLQDSGRFDTIEVRKRYRTMAMDEIAIVLLVHERPGLTKDGLPPTVARRIRGQLQFFPILSYDEGYGFTYGARFSFVNALGRGTRLSIPFTGGGTKRIAIEADRTFRTGPLTRLSGSFGYAERENPHFDVDDGRIEVKARAERRLFDMLTLGGNIARTRVTFSPVREQFWTPGADVTLDTRRDPAFPSDAILATVAWNRLSPIGTSSFGGDAIDRYRLDARGYKRVFRQNVVAVRAQYDTASAPLPPYEQWLLGGSNLRGTPAGSYAGDKRFLWSAEARVPFSSPLNRGRTGFNVFMDGGAIVRHDEKIFDAPRFRSAGAGLFLNFAVINLNLNVARSLDTKRTRVHFGTGFTF